MSRQWYSKRHYLALSNGGPDTPAQIASRIRLRKIGERANTEMMAKFAPLTADNIREAATWQENRIKELTNGK